MWCCMKGMPFSTIVKKWIGRLSSTLTVELTRGIACLAVIELGEVINRAVRSAGDIS